MHAADGGKDIVRRTAELCGVALSHTISKTSDYHHYGLKCRREHEESPFVTSAEAKSPA